MATTQYHVLALGSGSVNGESQTNKRRVRVECFKHPGSAHRFGVQGDRQPPPHATSLCAGEGVFFEELRCDSLLDTIRLHKVVKVKAFVVVLVSSPYRPAIRDEDEHDVRLFC